MSFCLNGLWIWAYPAIWMMFGMWLWGNLLLLMYRGKGSKKEFWVERDGRLYLIGKRRLNEMKRENEEKWLKEKKDYIKKLEEETKQNTKTEKKKTEEE